jgi:hypothetical protein
MPDDKRDEEDQLGPYWAVLRRSRGEREPTPEERVSGEHPGDLVIATDRNRVIVRIHPDGTVAYGEGYEADDAARALWEAIGRRRLDFDRRLNHLQLLELHVALVAAADESYEQAQRRAQEPTAQEIDRFQEELCRRNLEARVHGMIEFAREYVVNRPDLVELARSVRIPGSGSGSVH